MRSLNLGCGNVYVDAACWTNLDFVKTGPAVIACDLLAPLPFASGSFDLVYSSHFLEHVPRSLVPGFLRECWRVLAPGGVLRLVLPDGEEMFRTYLDLRSTNQHEQADFVMMEIIDQCVRSRVHGEMGEFYDSVAAMPSPKRESWVAFIRQRTGQDLDDPGFLAKPIPTKLPSLAAGQSALPSLGALFADPFCLPAWFRQVLNHVAIQLLPSAFRVQNVSLTMLGERHHWLWDFHQLKVALCNEGFVSVYRMTHATSGMADFPFVPLDMTPSGQPRKGVDSLFVEASKPSAGAGVAVENP